MSIRLHLLSLSGLSQKQVVRIREVSSRGQCKWYQIYYKLQIGRNSVQNCSVEPQPMQWSISFDPCPSSPVCSTNSSSDCSEILKYKSKYCEHFCWNRSSDCSEIPKIFLKILFWELRLWLLQYSVKNKLTAANTALIIGILTSLKRHADLKAVDCLWWKTALFFSNLTDTESNPHARVAGNQNVTFWPKLRRPPYLGWVIKGLANLYAAYRPWLKWVWLLAPQVL